MSSDDSPEGKAPQRLRAAVQGSREPAPSSDFLPLLALAEKMHAPLLGIAAPGKSHEDQIAALQTFLAKCGEASQLAQDVLERRLVAQPKVSRAGYLKALSEIIPRPSDAEMENWRSGWEALVVENRAIQGGRDVPNEKDRQQAVTSLEAYLEKKPGIMANRQKLGASADAAVALFASVKGGRAMARALRQRDSRHAAITHRFVEAVAEMAQAQQDSGRLAPVLYWPLDGKHGLTREDPAWEQLLEPDSTGFRGALTVAPIDGLAEHDELFTEAGIATPTVGKDGVQKYTPCDSDVVAFVSQPRDAGGDLHSAAITGTNEGTFPPNTLFTVQSVTDKKEFTLASGKTVRQRLITVTATYRLASPALDAGKDDSKLCSTPFTLSYAGREAFVNGLDDITAKPLLTMFQEFARDHSWTDWKGVSYTLRGEMDYVRGAAAKREGCTPGTRDANNHGKTPEDFAKLINGFIEERRKGGFTGGLPEQHAHLTLEEVLGIRLYSGPAYQPLNEFLRQISNLTGSFRDRVAKMPGMTFAATVGHIIRGIRKLAAVVTPEEASKPLWRGVRGVLPEKFWVKDAAGMVCATDVALMSTSRNQHTPVHYMGHGQNVLWKLSPGLQTDSGFHYGADISALSQFAGEDEVLFPPYTMLRVEAAAGAAGPRPGLQVSEHEAESGKKKYLQISVLPQFV